VTAVRFSGSGLEHSPPLRGAKAQLAQSGAPPPPPPASGRYQVMTTVPENWIPFVPVHVDGDNREVQLQRAALPRILEGDPNPPVKVQPRTMLMRQGLDEDPPQPYLVYEEEVSRAGTRLTQFYQRHRRARLHLAPGAEADRSRRGLERAGVRPDHARHTRKLTAQITERSPLTVTSRRLGRPSGSSARTSTSRRSTSTRARTTTAQMRSRRSAQASAGSAWTTSTSTSSTGRCARERGFVESGGRSLSCARTPDCDRFGVSNFSSTQLERVINATGVTPAVNQAEPHPYFQQAELRRVHAGARNRHRGMGSARAGQPPRR
jgi:hypothetical protein